MPSFKRTRKAALVSAIAVLAAGASTVSYATSDARAMGRGGTGVAHADGVRSVVFNPALVNAVAEEPGFKGWLGFGVALEDPDDVIDRVDDIIDEIDRLEDRANAGELGSGDADELIRMLKRVDRDQVFADAGVSMVFGLPSNAFAKMALVIKNETSLGLGFIFDPEDEQRLRDAETSGDFEADDLQSEVLAAGVMITDIGLTMGRAFELPEIGETDIAVTLKYQDIRVLEYQETIEGFDDNEPDLDDDVKKHSGFNIDVGVHKSWLDNGALQTGLVIHNLIPQEYKGPRGGKYRQRPLPVVGAAYDWGWVQVSSDLDLVPRDGLSVLDDRQMFRLGAEFPLGQVMQLRAGYRHDLKNNFNDAWTAGIGFTPGRVFSFDLAAFTAGSNSLGATFQFGLEF